MPKPSNKIRNILVTGGAGFIGSFLVDELISKKYNVRILDNLEDQVHHGKKPDYLNKSAEFIKGDVKDYKTIKRALKNIDVVYHLAASVGVAQSNYEIKKFVDTNSGGIANLLDILINNKHQVKKIIINSSMTGLGEGNYLCKKCGIIRPPFREEEQLNKNLWELYCPNCHRKIVPIPTDEKALEFPNSIYALTKKNQQDMLLLIAKMYGIPAVALRCFNVYGPRQSLSNPYTGVTAIFISRLKNNQPAFVYEDGMQTRDFVSVHDVVKALIKAMKSPKANYNFINIGSGHPLPIKGIAEILAKLLEKPGLVKVSGDFRKNDIRHCYADIKKAKKLLNWKPEITLEQGFKELIKWSETQKAVDKFNSSVKKLKTKKLQA